MAVEHRQLLFLTRNSANVRFLGIALYLVCAEKQRVQRVKIGYRSYSGCTQECEAANEQNMGIVDILVCRQEKRQTDSFWVSRRNWFASQVTEEAHSHWVSHGRWLPPSHHSRNRVYR